MFEAILIIFVIGVGPTDDFSDSGSTNVTVFSTMEQCEVAKAEVKKVWVGWHYPIAHSAKCVNIPMGTHQPSPIVPPSPIIPPSSLYEKTHSRWNDL